MKKNNVGEFYDKMSAEYSALIQRCVPRYHEMLQMLTDYIPDDLKPKRILELGCGSGLLSQRILKKYPNAEIHLVDLSRDILEQCKSNLNNPKNVKFIQADFKDLVFEEASFDLVYSSIAIHHLINDDKKTLFVNVYKWLRSDGVFIYADQTRGATDEIYKKHMALWEKASTELGANKEEWDEWMEHQKSHDYHLDFETQLLYLKEAGFSLRDIIWRNLLWTLYFNQKK